MFRLARHIAPTELGSINCLLAINILAPTEQRTSVSPYLNSRYYEIQLRHFICQRL